MLRKYKLYCNNMWIPEIDIELKYLNFIKRHNTFFIKHIDLIDFLYENLLFFDKYTHKKNMYLINKKTSLLINHNLNLNIKELFYSDEILDKMVYCYNSINLKIIREFFEIFHDDHITVFYQWSSLAKHTIKDYINIGYVKKVDTL